MTLGELEPDSWSDGFAKVGSSVVSISANGVDKYQLAIDSATAQVFADATRRAALVGCEPQVAEDVCVDAFIARFGRLSWRRPLTEAQVLRYGALARSMATLLGDVTEAVRLTTNALLFSPYFLYRLERGQADANARWWRFDSYEMASRLSFFLANTTPDATLLDAAERDGLATAEGIRGQAERLLASVSGRESVGNFATELFRLAIVRTRAKDPERFPTYSSALQSAMAREVPAMFESVVFDERAPALDLFTTRRTFVNDSEKWDVFTIEPDGSGTSQVAESASWGSWISNDEILYVRGTKIFRKKLGGDEQQIMDSEGVSELDGALLQQPELSKDGKYLAITLRGSKRETGLWDLEKKTWTQTGLGCQINWTPDQAAIYWVHPTGNGGSRVLKMPITAGAPPKDPSLDDLQLMDLPGRRSHEYFPELSSDGKWMVWGATQRGHDHDTADYEIYLWETVSPPDKAVRLTYNSGNDRWPDVFLPSAVPSPTEPVATPTDPPPAEAAPLALASSEPVDEPEKKAKKSTGNKKSKKSTSRQKKRKRGEQ